MSRSSPAGVVLLLHLEGFEGHPYRPDTPSSGVTLDFGDDLGQRRLADFRAVWGHHLPPSDLEALEPVVGMRGAGAGLYLAEHHLERITISRATATAVFTEDTLPEYEDDVVHCMPGAESLPPDAFGALTSLVYNRGTAMEDNPAKRAPGDRRLEMRIVRSAVAAYAATDLVSTKIACLLGIATELEKMGRRLWPPEKDGLQHPDWNRILRERRHDEAALVRQAAGRAPDGSIP